MYNNLDEEKQMNLNEWLMMINCILSRSVLIILSALIAHTIKVLCRTLLKKLMVHIQLSRSEVNCFVMHINIIFYMYVHVDVLAVYRRTLRRTTKDTDRERRLRRSRQQRVSLFLSFCSTAL